MKLVRFGYDIKVPLKNVILTITGNGKMEYKILSAFAEKYNGLQKVIWFPKTPFVKHRKTGLSVLDVVGIIVSRYKIENFLYIVDKEHVSSYEEIRSYLEKKSVRDISLEGNILHGKYGLHKLMIYCAICGYSRRIEENISKLISIRFNVEIQATKEKIRDFLKKRGISIRKLIKDATKNQLRKSFQDLSNAIEHIEGHPNKN